MTIKERMIEIRKRIDSRKITPENISERYPTMNDKNKLAWQDTLDSKFQKRIHEVANKLNLSTKSLFENGYRTTENVGAGANIVEVRHFGVKDNLQPIDEYVMDIKKSIEYKSYINKQNNFNSDLSEFITLTGSESDLDRADEILEKLEAQMEVSPSDELDEIFNQMNQHLNTLI